MTYKKRSEKNDDILKKMSHKQLMWKALVCLGTSSRNLWICFCTYLHVFLSRGESLFQLVVISKKYEAACPHNQFFTHKFSIDLKPIHVDNSNDVFHLYKRSFAQRGASTYTSRLAWQSDRCHLKQMNTF